MPSLNQTKTDLGIPAESQIYAVGIIRREQKGLALEIDREKLTEKGKAEAIQVIKDVLSQLED